MKRNDTSVQQDFKIGKIDFETFSRYLLKRLGKKDGSVLVPPLTGVDAGVIDIGNDKVLIIAEDPIFSIPKQLLEMFGWYTVHIGASDVAVMGVKPRYMTYTLLMPPQTTNDEFRTIVDSIHKTARELEIAIVGGHTGYYPGFAAPTIGGIAVFAIAEGSLLITVRPSHSEKILSRLKEEGIDVSLIGSVLKDAKKRIMRRRDGSVVPLAIPEQDPFWPAFFRRLEPESRA